MDGTVANEIVVGIKVADCDPDFGRQAGVTGLADRAKKVQLNRYGISRWNTSPFGASHPADFGRARGLLRVMLILLNFFQQFHGSFDLPLELLQLLLLSLQHSFLLPQLSLQLLFWQEHEEDKQSRNVHTFLDPGKPGVVQFRVSQPGWGTLVAGLDVALL